MHIFLTGPKGVGKSTVIYKVLDLLDQNIRQDQSSPFIPGGFFTHSGLSGDRDVYISPAGLNKYYTLSNKIASRDGPIPAAHIEVFETLGIKILEDSKKSELIIMDELGFLEDDAPNFKNAVCALLDKNIPILGTLRQGEIAWLGPIKTHPEVELIEVNHYNRDDLPGLITSKLYGFVVEK